MWRAAFTIVPAHPVRVGRDLPTWDRCGGNLAARGAPRLVEPHRSASGVRAASSDSRSLSRHNLCVVSLPRETRLMSGRNPAHREQRGATSRCTSRTPPSAHFCARQPGPARAPKVAFSGRLSGSPCHPCGRPPASACGCRRCPTRCSCCSGSSRRCGCSAALARRVGRVGDLGGTLLAHALLAQAFVLLVVLDARPVILGHDVLLSADDRCRRRGYPTPEPLTRASAICAPRSARQFRRLTRNRGANYSRIEVSHSCVATRLLSHRRAVL